MRRKYEKLTEEDRTKHAKFDSLINQEKVWGPMAVDEEKELEQQNSRKHPTSEQLLIREATKWLTPKQKKVWELYNYDKLTQDEIAKKLGKSRTTIETQIHQCEARIAKWIKSNTGAYELLKQDFKNVDNK